MAVSQAAVLEGMLECEMREGGSLELVERTVQERKLESFPAGGSTANQHLTGVVGCGMMNRRDCGFLDCFNRS